MLFLRMQAQCLLLTSCALLPYRRPQDRWELVWLKYGSVAAAVFPLCPQFKGQLLESQVLSSGSLLVVVGTVLQKGKGVISLGTCLEIARKLL